MLAAIVWGENQRISLDHPISRNSRSLCEVPSVSSRKIDDGMYERDNGGDSTKRGKLQRSARSHFGPFGHCLKS